MGLTAAATGKSPLELLDPTDEDSVINPANPRTFLTVTLPDGSRISPFQAIRPVARLFLKPAADALGAGYEGHRRAPLPEPGSETRMWQSRHR